MFKIENLLDIFPDQNIKELLLRSYFLSQEQNKELSDRIFDQFLLLVMQNQSINIVFDVSKENSYFDQGKNVIYLNDLSSEVFFHELTHLLSFNFLKFQVPNEYYIFINNFFTNSNNTSLITKFLDLCKKRKKEIIQSFSTEIEKEYITNANNERDKISKDSLNMELNLIALIEDIVDSIYNGESATRGLTYINNDDTNSFKVKKTNGHGCEYYTTNNYQFEEILANYQAIMLIDPNNELFVLLKNILGQDFISFLDQRCNEMCGKFFKPELSSKKM